MLKLKNEKSPGICGIHAETLKAGKTIAVKWLHWIMNLARDNGKVPEDWLRAVIYINYIYIYICCSST